MAKSYKNSDTGINQQVDNQDEAPGQAVKPRRSKLWLDLVMLASLVALAIALWIVTPELDQQAPLFDDLDMLAGSQEPEFYLELELFYWLERQHGQD